MDNEEILKSFTHRFNSQIDGLRYFKLNLEPFEIGIIVGRPLFSLPELILDNISDYEKISVELCEFNKSGVRHDINLKYDPRFESQNWEMEYTSVVNYRHSVVVSVHTVCDIVRYCNKLSSMKAFW